MPWSIITVAIAFVVFGVLSRLTPCNPKQGVFTRDLPDDVIYYFVGTLFYTGLSALALKFVMETAFAADAPKMLRAVERGYGVLPTLPIWVQVVIVLVVTDVIQYWLHRAFHTRPLWAFHAIHHSAENVDWTTTFRVHPVNFAAYSMGVAMLTGVMGFSPLVFAIVAPLNFFIGAFVHANLNWTLGPFRYVVASPVFHRWHHSSDPAVHDKNFAPTFPVLDLMFGTFHMPKGQLPEGYGAEGVPSNFVGQMLYPLRPVTDALTRRLARPAKAGLDSGPA
jgi:sterol desaturase/sphingolipid hydroxylase (fatty acid hydroxylase superfamily)